MKIKRLIATFLCAITILGKPVVSNAMENDYTASISSEYKQATFKFEFEESQTYEVTVISPSGEPFYKKFTGKTGEVTVLVDGGGEYIINVCAPKDYTVKSISADCKKTTINDSGDSAALSSAISGLQIYFIDGDLVAKWDDTGVGNVNISVTNPATMQILAEDTVKNTSYRKALPDNVEEVEVYIVPTSSSKINGAGSRYTVRVVRDVDGDVLYGDSSLTNKQDFTFNVDIPDNTTIISKVNDDYTYEQYYESAGTYDITVKLDDGDNKIITYVMDKNSNMRSYTFSLYKDITSPEITFNQNYDGMKVDGNAVNISGRVVDFAKLTINGYDVTTDEFGRFQIELPLEADVNEVVVSAVDAAGNDNTLKLTLYKKSSGGGGLIIIFFVIIVVVAGTFFILKFFGKNKKEGSDNKTDNKDDFYDIPKTVNTTSDSKTIVEQSIVKNLSEKPEKPAKKDKIKESKEKNKKQGVLMKKQSKQLRKMENRKTIGTLISCVTWVIVVYVFCFFVCKNAIIESGSMEPTIMTGDMAFFNRLAYKFSDVQRGDIVCFWSDEKNKAFCKRIIGVAGDKISFHDGYTFINDTLADETAYIPAGVETNCAKTFTVPDGCVFVMGDNREDSFDSRFFENPYIPIEKIYGKYMGDCPDIFGIF